MRTKTNHGEFYLKNPNSTRESRPRNHSRDRTKLFTTLPCHSSHISSTGRSEDFYLHKGSGSCPDHLTAWDDHACTKECDAPNNNCPLGKKCGPRCQANVYRCPRDQSVEGEPQSVFTPLPRWVDLNEGNNTPMETL